MKNSLLAKAKKYPSKTKNISILDDGSLDLAMAFMSGNITISQVKHALGISNGSPAYVFIARTLREATLRGTIILKKKK